MHRKIIPAKAFLMCALALAATAASAGDAEVQRQLQIREQQQIELRLKMQQQQERAAQPSPSHSTDVRRRQLERDQQQRLREMHDRQSRATVAPDAAGTPEATPAEADRQRALRSGTEQLNRFDTERRIEGQREGQRGNAAPQ